MTVSTSLAYTIFIVLSIAFSIVAFVFALRKTKHIDAERAGFGPKVLLFACLFSGAVPGVYCWSKFTTTVIEISPIDENQCIVIGSAHYTSSDGHTVPIDYNENDVYIINTGNDTLIREYVAYGIGLNTDDNKELIAPHSLLICRDLPDYYPWDLAPDQIEVPKGTFMGARYWFHYSWTPDMESRD